MLPDNLSNFVVFAFFLILFVSFYRRRETLWFNLRRIATALAAYLLVASLLSHAGWTETQATIVGIGAGLIVDLSSGKRTRYIPKVVKRKVIARFESRTGEKFSRRIHEIHHVVPFSKGGSNTEDNLQVLRRKENRAKGAKSPWWDLLGR